MFEVRDLSFSYSDKPLLSGVSFIVSPGEAVSIVGPNGAGKTTLLKVLATLMPPDSGLVLVDGQDALARPRRYRRQLGYMPEAPALYEEMTVKSYLRYRAILKGETEKRIRRRVSEAAELCRLTDVLDRTIGAMSLGFRRRVALADALLLRPRVLLLDDFLAGIDRRLREETGEIVQNVAAFASVVVTGHEIADLARWTTRFLVLSGGRIAADMTRGTGDLAPFVERLDSTLKGLAS